MPVEERDVAPLTHLAMRIRQETYGAGPWDEHGTAKIIAELKGRNLHLTTEHIIRHAADPKARNPGVLRGAYTPPAPPPEKVRLGVTRAEQCTRCGGRLPDCACTREGLAVDGPATPTRPTTVMPPPPDFKAARDRLRTGAPLEQEESNPS